MQPRPGKVLMAVTLLCLALMPVEAGKIYWTAHWTFSDQTSKVYRADPDGSNVEIELETSSVFLGLDLDPERDFLYYGHPPGIKRASATSCNLLTDVYPLSAVKVDADAGKMYWITETGQGDEMYRANLNGTDVELLFPPGPGSDIGRLDLDRVNGKIYFTHEWPHGIRRMNMDGSNPEVVVDLPIVFLDVAVDPSGGKVYWAEDPAGSFPGAIRRADLDGSNVEELVLIDTFPSAAIGVDPVAGKIYYSFGPGGDRSIARANLDGSQQQTIVTHLSNVAERFAIDPVGDGAGQVLQCEGEAPVPAAGAVPDGAAVPGAPLTIAKSPFLVETLQWDSSCAVTDTAFAVYTGTLGDFTSHSPQTCSTPGPTLNIDLPTDSYVLIVPRNEIVEGSYGTDSEGNQRPAALEPCLPKHAPACE